ncbi:MAG: DUF4252 domain-containing protein [Xanthomonadales bacterium]|nr:DUF4252 domain-containing protein [Xanthomonadales bacterium]
MIRRLILVLLLTALSAGTALAQPLDGVPGYVDFGDLAGVTGAEPAVEISLGQALLSFISAAAREEDPELADALGRLRSIRLNVFQLDADSLPNARKRAGEIARRLEQDFWEPAVSVRSEDSTIHMYMKSEGDRVAGMTVMMVGQDGEAVFMNIVGEIDPAQLGRVAARFGVDLNHR